MHKTLLVLIALLSWQSYSANQGECIEFMNKSFEQDGAFKVSEHSEGLSLSTDYSFYTSVNNKKKSASGKSKQPNRKVKIKWDKDKNLKMYRYRGESLDTGGIEVKFAQGENGDCYPSEGRPLRGSIGGFDTSLCRKIHKMYEDNPSLKDCSDKKVLGDFATLVREKGQDGYCNYCKKSYYPANFIKRAFTDKQLNIPKTMRDNVFLRIDNIYQNCLDHGLRPFMSDDNLWEKESGSAQQSKEANVIGI